MSEIVFCFELLDAATNTNQYPTPGAVTVVICDSFLPASRRDEPLHA